MAFKRSNEPGALVGLLSSLALLSALGFGRPRPPPTPLPVSTHLCPGNLTLPEAVAEVSPEVRVRQRRQGFHKGNLTPT